MSAERFKRLRLGEKEGSIYDLTLKLEKAVNEYRKTFPKTTDEQIAAALEDLLDLFELEDDE